MQRSGCTITNGPAGTLRPLGILLLLIILGLAALPAAAQYTYKVFDESNASQSGPFNRGTSATAINDAGDVAGYYADANDVVHGFLLSRGNFTSFDFPAAGTFRGFGTQPFGINNAGTIVGIYTDTAGNDQGFLRTAAGNLVAINIQGAQTIDPLAINNSGY